MANVDVAEFRSELRAQTRLINLNRQDMNELREEMTAARTETRAGFATLARMLQQLGAQPDDA